MAQPTMEIHVSTLKNGYSLTVKFENGKTGEYMYFNPKELLEGMQYHIGHEIKESCNIDEFALKLAERINKKKAEEAAEKLENEMHKDITLPVATRVTFRAETYIRGKSLKDCYKKWGEIPLFSEEAQKRYFTNYVELISVENAETHEDVSDYWETDDTIPDEE